MVEILDGGGDIATDRVDRHRARACDANRHLPHRHRKRGRHGDCIDIGAVDDEIAALPEDGEAGAVEIDDRPRPAFLNDGDGQIVDHRRAVLRVGHRVRAPVHLVPGREQRVVNGCLRVEILNEIGAQRIAIFIRLGASGVIERIGIEAEKLVRRGRRPQRQFR